MTKNNYRLTVLTIFFIAFYILIITRLFYWQIIKGEYLSASAADQRWTTSELTPERGQILAQDEFPLVDNQPTFDIFLDRTLADQPENKILNQILPLIINQPKIIYPPPFVNPKTETAKNETERQIATPSAQILTVEDQIATESARLINILDNQQLAWINLFKQIPVNTYQQIKQLKISGLIAQPNSNRHYSEASAAAQLLGFVANNSAGYSQGYFGLEGYYQRELSGQAGKLAIETDALGNPIILGQRHFESTQPGRTLITHIDRTIQFLIEQKLEQALTKYQASSGTISIMDPRTGAIIASTARPSYSAPTLDSYPHEYYPNPVINQSYEPGSTFKVLITASAINEGLVDSQTICPCDGPVRIPPYTIATWDYQYHPNSTINDILVHSDNVGMVFIAQKFTPETLIKYIRSFGFGQLTAIDLQEEATPELKKEWRSIDLATASFGQGIAITPIQMLTAVSALANEGWLMQPQVVDKIIIYNPKTADSDQSSFTTYWLNKFNFLKNNFPITNNEQQFETKIVDIPPQKIRQVISAETANLITEIMVNSAKFGEAKWTFLKGYKIAGKTGTAQIPLSGQYDEEKTIASFVGFAPADDPKFVMLVTLREPQTSPWGSETAAPLWFDIAKQLFLHWNIAPSN